MRQGQQNRRGRGRGRKPQNPLSRSYESNGPDVKVRGTASHVAEKYMSLARDALSSGDIVAAESYLQHAEHYNRIVMAAQQQASQNSQSTDQANGGGRSRQNAEQGGGENAEAEAAEASAGSQDRQRHTGDREHHGGRGRGRQNENRNENRNEGVNDANGAEPEKAQAADEGETVPDTVS